MTDSIEGEIGHNGRPEPEPDTPTDGDLAESMETLRRFLILTCAEIERCRGEDHSKPYAAGVRDVVWNIVYWVFVVEDHFDEKVASILGESVPGIEERIADPEKLREWLVETLTSEDFSAVSDYSVDQVAEIVDREMGSRP